MLIKNPLANAGAPSSILVGRSLRRKRVNPLVFCLENPMHRGAWGYSPRGPKRVGHNLVIKPPLLLIQKRSTGATVTATFRLCGVVEPSG